MTKRKDFWPFLTLCFLFAVSLLSLGFFVAHREGLWVVSAVVAMGAFFLVKNWIPLNFRNALEYEIRGTDPWGMRERVLRIVEAYNLSELTGLKVCILPQEQPVALALGLKARSPVLVVSEGLLRSLDDEDQQALACLLVACLEMHQRWSSSLLLTAILSWCTPLLNPWLMLWVHRDADGHALLRGADRGRLGQLLWRLSASPPAHSPFLPKRVIHFRAHELLLSPLPSKHRIDQRLRNLVGYFPI